MVWDLDPVAVEWGALSVRWYGVLFAMGLAVAMAALPVGLLRFGLPRDHALPLAVILSAALLIGSHLFHLLYYEPEALLADPSRLWRFGAGLASHGGGFFVMLGCLLWARVTGQDYNRLLDVAFLAFVPTMVLVRLGNFANAEICGLPADVPWAVEFARGSLPGPRHPVQLYEALGSLVAGALAWTLALRRGPRLAPGGLYYACMGLYLLFRFISEFYKDRLAVDGDFLLSTGQLLSLIFLIPFAWAALFTREFRLWAGHGRPTGS